MFLIFYLITKLITIYSWALIIYILMSWFPNARDTKIGQFLTQICEPYLGPFRRIIPPIGILDISPLVAFFVLNFATYGIWQLYSWIS
nr:YggT family protein [uncultured Bacillus sp.]